MESVSCMFVVVDSGEQHQHALAITSVFNYDNGRDSLQHFNNGVLLHSSKYNHNTKDSILFSN